MAFTNFSATSRIHVAAAVVVNDRGEVLISRRPDHVHQGGLWEFPGGKLEAGEDVYAALVRELNEELGLAIENARPLICIPYDYPDKQVLLDVWQVTAFSGGPKSLEGQEWAWVAPGELYQRDFPAANRPIVRALNLPDSYLITPEPQADTEEFLLQLERSLQSGIRLVQLRAKSLPAEEYRALALQVHDVCRHHGAALLLNASPGLAQELEVSGVHLTSGQLMSMSERPLAEDKMVAASVHTHTELAHACAIGVDFVVLSPVLATRSHPDATPIGWEMFRQLTQQATVPVYALGGMTTAHLKQAQECGAQGIAAISGLWNNA